MNMQDLEAMKILEEIAQELDKGAPWILYRQDLATILRSVAAHHQQPAPVDLGQFREAVRAIDDFVFHRERCGFPHQICDCGMKEARERLLSIIDNVGVAECLEVSGYIATVPDKCDRIIWRGQYHHLPLHQSAPVVGDAMVRRVWELYWRAEKSGDVTVTEKEMYAIASLIASAQGVQS